MPNSNLLGRMELIGPHEGIEFDLMERGEKNLALFYEIIPDLFPILAVRADYGALTFSRTLALAMGTVTIPYAILFRCGHDAAAQELRALVCRENPGFDPLAERRIGELLGYPRAAIDHFIQSWPNGGKVGPTPA